MKFNRVIIPAVCLVPLLSSCAPFQGTDRSAWNIQPMLSIRNSSESPETYYQLGRYYQGQNRQEQALSAYRKALALDAGFAEARNGVGVIYSMQGKLAEAIGQFRLAAEQSPAAAHIHNNLGYALYLNGLYAEAAQVLEHAVALDPANPAARANLAQAQQKSGVAAPLLARAPQAQQVAKPVSDVRAVQASAQPLATVLPDNPPAIDVTAAFLPAQASPGEAAPQAAPLPAVTQSQAATETASAAQAQAQAQAQAVPSQSDLPQLNKPVATEVAERLQIPLVANHVEVVQVAPNIYELLERAKTQPVSAPLAQAQAKAPKHGMVMPVAQGQQRKSFRIEVSNGNGLNGMGRKVATFLEDFGYAGSRLTNQKTFQVPASEVQYRSGYLEEARSLTAHLVGKPALVQMSDLRQDISIKVILGKDWLREVAYFDRAPKSKVRLARSGGDA